MSDKFRAPTDNTATVPTAEEKTASTIALRLKKISSKEHSNSKVVCATDTGQTHPKKAQQRPSVKSMVMRRASDRVSANDNYTSAIPGHIGTPGASAGDFKSISEFCAEPEQIDRIPIAAHTTDSAHQVISPTELAAAVSDIAKSQTDEKTIYDDTQTTAFNKITKLVVEENRIDLSQYNPSIIGRLLERRRVISGSVCLEHYYDLLASHTREISALRNDLLVSATGFFRDEPAWRKLSEIIIPALVKKIPEHETIRVWVAACATGEEAYTMAMVLREVLDDMGRHHQDAKIFATDIDEHALQRAASGKYPGSIVADIPPELLKKYFIADEHFYQVKPQLRDMIMFAPHNLLEDAPFTRIHIAACRNALIYLQNSAQEHISRMLNFSLVTGGMLFLGPFETAGESAKQFKVHDHQWSIQEKTGNSGLTTLSVPQEPLTPLRLDTQYTPDYHRANPPNSHTITACNRNNEIHSLTQRLREQEVELQQARTCLQRTTRKLEATNEVYVATHKQLLKAAEDLQTTREELHCVHEELRTISSEYQVKVNELTELNNDIDNLPGSTDIGVIFLDGYLNIRKFTTAATRAVPLVPDNIGRPFESLTYNFDYPALVADVRRVLSLGDPIERETSINSTDNILVKIHPYRAGNELTVGVVISFTDISELKQAEDAIAQVEGRYRHLFESDMFGIIVSNIDSGTIIDANETFLTMIEANRTMLPLRDQQVFPKHDRASASLAIEELLLNGTTPPTAAHLLTSRDSIVPVVISRSLISRKDKTCVSFVMDANWMNQKQRVIHPEIDEIEAVSANLQQFDNIAHANYQNC